MASTGRLLPPRLSLVSSSDLVCRLSQDSEDALQAGQRSNRISDREDEYHARRQRVLSPSRADAFALGDKTPDVSTRSYKDVMAEQQVARERAELQRKIKEQQQQEAEGNGDAGAVKKRRRWDQPVPQGAGAAADATKKAKTRWDDVATPGPQASRWDATPTPGREAGGVAASSRWDATPVTPCTPSDAPMRVCFCVCVRVFAERVRVR